MIEVRKISWGDRYSMRSLLRKRGFISQVTLSKKGKVDFKSMRNVCEGNLYKHAVMLVTGEAITYWYHKDVEVIYKGSCV